MERSSPLSDLQWEVLSYLENSSEQLSHTRPAVAFNLDLPRDDVDTAIDGLLNEDLIRVIKSEPETFRITSIGSQRCKSQED